MDKKVLERETAAAVAEAGALEAAVDTRVHSKHDPLLEAAPVDVMQHTCEYVEQMNLQEVTEPASKVEPLPPDETIQPHTELPDGHSASATRFKLESRLHNAEFYHMQPRKDYSNGNTQDGNQSRRHTRFAQSSTPPFPVASPTLQSSQRDKTDISDFVRCLLVINLLAQV